MSVAHTWGSTPAERTVPFPCDRWVLDADAVLFRAIDVGASPAVAFRWLCQLRVAPYSYDWLDNWGRTSPRRLTPGLDQLAVGQRVMDIFELVDFETDRHLTIVLHRMRAVFGDVAVTYRVGTRGETASRFVVKIRVRSPPTPGIGRLMRVLLPWGDLVMMRKQLLTLRALAEGRPA